MNIKINRDVAISSSGLIFNAETGETFITNPIGIEILKSMAAGKSLKEIQETILTSYHTTAESLEVDFCDFLTQLNEFKIVIFIDPNIPLSLKKPFTYQ